MSDNRYDYVRWIEGAFIEQLRYDWAELVEDEREAWGAESVAEGYEYSGMFHQILDGLVPIYTDDVVKLWLDLGMPEGDDWGHEVSEMDIVTQMRVGIYSWADDYARRNFEGWHNEVVTTIVAR